jgi:hypothetical protein
MAHRLPELWPKPFAFRPEGWLPDAPGYVEPPAVRPVPSMAATGAASGSDSRRSRDQGRDRVPRTTHRSRATEPPYRGNRRGGQRTGRRCTRPGDGFEDFGEQLSGVGLVVVGGVIVLTAEDGEELRAGLEEAAAFADGLEVAAVGGAWVVEARITHSRWLGVGPRRAGTVWEDG